MRRAFLGSTALAVFLAACGPTYEAPATLKGVRLIGVHKDKPYAAPGETVKLSMLLFDGAEKKDGEKKRKVSVQWFGGCDNPPGDSYPGCFLGSGGDAGAGVPFAGLRQIGEGLEAEYTLPSTILDRPRPPGGATPYGLSFVFFTACAGSLAVAPGERIPIMCVDDAGARVNADGFVVGYTQIFAYESLENTNPKIKGLIIRGTSYEPGDASPVECVGDACVELAKREFGIAEENPGPAGVPDGGVPDGGVPDGGAPEPPPSGGGPDAGVGCDPQTDQWCVDRCDPTIDIDDCPKHALQVAMTEDENDDVYETSPGTTTGEQMWVNYYIERGKLAGDTKIVRDATEGWQGHHSDTEFFAPQTPGPFHIWAAAHDNRGGVEWTRAQLYAK
jgi:hypothetical protein